MFFIEKRPGYVANAPGHAFSRFFERKAPWDEPTTREGLRKGPAAEAEKDASQHTVGGIARVSDRQQSCFKCGGLRHDGLVGFVCSVCRANTERERESGVSSTRPIFSFLGTPREAGAFGPIFVLKNAPGALFQNCFMVRPGGCLLRLLRYVVDQFNASLMRKSDRVYSIPYYYISISTADTFNMPTLYH